MNRRYIIMAGNLGQGFDLEFAKRYRDSLNDAFRCEIADGNMDAIKVVVQEGSGSVPRGGWEQDDDEDVIRRVAEDTLERLIYDENYVDPEEHEHFLDELDDPMDDDEWIEDHDDDDDFGDSTCGPPDWLDGD
jgi:hypothetical protein